MVGRAGLEGQLVELATHATPDEVRAAVRHLVEAEAPDRDKELLDVLADRSSTCARSVIWSRSTR